MRNAHTQSTCRVCGSQLPAGPLSGLCPACLLDSSLSSVQASEAAAKESGLPVTIGQPWRFGRYQVLEEISRGGMGVVFRARDEALRRDVALKFLRAGALASREDTRRLFVEARAAARLRHPNIVPVFEVGGADCEQPFLAMTFVPGGTLAQRLKRGSVSPDEAAVWLAAVARAVHYAHQHGILHRDLKPGNILFDETGAPLVSDFGLARLLDEDQTLTRVDVLLGTPAYLAPEQAGSCTGEVTTAADIHALGAVLYEVLTGRPPFTGDTLPALLHRIAETAPVWPSKINSRVPRDLETICLKCLEKEPSKRYATVQEIAEELDRFLKREPIRARPVTRAERAWRWCRRKPTLASVIAVSGLLLLAILIGSPIAVYQIDRARKEARRNLYAADMNLAQQAVQADEFDQALRLLNRHRPQRRESGDRRQEPARSRQQSILTPEARFQTPDLRGWEWRYLWRQCQGEQRFILGEHTYGATAVGMLADGKTVFSAGNDKSVRLWDFESRRPIGRLLHSAAIGGAAASPDGRWLATATSESHEGRPVLLWGLATLKIDATLATNFWLRYRGITFSPDSKWLAFATQFGGIRLWDVNARSEVTNLQAFHPSHEPLGVAFSPDSRTLAYNENEDGAILLWDIASRSVTNRLTGHESFVTALAFSLDGQTLASGSHDRTAKLWNLAEEREGFAFTNRSGAVSSLVFSPDGRTLAMSGAGGAGRVIRLIEVETGKEKAQLRGHLKDVFGLAFTKDGQTLLSASDDGTIRVWDVVPGAKARSAHEFAPNSISAAWRPYGPALCLSTDGRHLLTVYTNQTYSLWDTLRLAEGERHPLPFTPTTMAAVAPGGRLAAFGSRGGEVMLWDVETGRARLLPRPGTNRIHLMVFSRNGRYLAAADSTKTVSQMAITNLHCLIRVWDTGAQSEPHVLSTDGQIPMSLIFSADARTLMTGFWSGSINLWQLDKPGGQVASFYKHDWPAEGGLALLPGGRTLISAGGTDIRFWDVRTRRESSKLDAKAGLFSSVALSDDGGRLAAGGSDGRITIWDVASHQELAMLEGHKYEVMQLAFTPEGKHLVSVSKDQLRVWRAAPWTETEAAEKRARK